MQPASSAESIGGKIKSPAAKPSSLFVEHGSTPLETGRCAVHTRIMPDKHFRQHSRNSVLPFLTRCLSGLINLWMGIGFPIACLTLLYALHSRHNWASSLMDKYPLLFCRHAGELHRSAVDRRLVDVWLAKKSSTAMA